MGRGVIEVPRVHVPCGPTPVFAAYLLCKAAMNRRWHTACEIGSSCVGLKRSWLKMLLLLLGIISPGLVMLRHRLRQIHHVHVVIDFAHIHLAWLRLLARKFWLRCPSAVIQRGRRVRVRVPRCDRTRGSYQTKSGIGRGEVGRSAPSCALRRCPKRQCLETFL